MKRLEKYKVNKIDGEFALLENMNNHELKLVELLLLPVVKENDTLIYDNNLYMIDDIKRRKRLKIIEEKLNKIKSIK